MTSPPQFASGPPPAPGRPKRRWWVAGIVAAWALVLAGAAVWSVRNDPPTVAEQRDIAAALPIVQRAGGFVVAAADGPGQVMEVGALSFDRDCALTPVRDGVEAAREVVVRVKDNEAPEVLESIAAKLPGDLHAAVEHNVDQTRYSLRGDAGEFVGVDAAIRDTDTTIRVRVSTGCRPLAGGVDYAPAPVPAVAGQEPDAFRDAVAALGGGTAATVIEVACPGGSGAARTVVADGVKAPADLGAALRDVAGGAVVVRAAAGEWAYRVGAVSMVVTAAEGAARVSATTGCAQ
ncbi:hypothetical protein [Symbioplanes lichenis]|uniref:hypothetical protein n=1 Tax=Symbioplanes lichenis TaxID=1629072 RepID=UPI0027381EE6|nr:hypothetical protein [Actinoplanes lichenis]